MTKLNTPRDYASADRMLGRRDEKKIGHNTKLVRTLAYRFTDAEDSPPGSEFGEELEAIAIRYHTTNVVVMAEDGTVELFSGGWSTITTAVRFNAFLIDHGFHVTTDRKEGGFRVHQFGNPNPFDFVEGFNFETDEGGRLRIGP